MMGSNWSPEENYKCPWDCVQAGCPGHVLKIEYSRTSDTVTVWIDAKPVHYFDDNSFAALLKAAGADQP